MGSIDLHSHSVFSDDGEFTPEQLAQRFFDAGVRLAALTDHNSVRGVPRFIEAAKKLGMDALAGVELDCAYSRGSLHLLGYGIDAQRYREIEEDLRQKEQSASRIRLAAVRRMGIHIDDERIAGLAPDGVITGEMLCEAALDDAANANYPLLAPYRQGGARSDNPFVNFYWDFCSQGKAAFAPVEYISFEKACALVADSGGTAVIAHPALTVGRDREVISYMAGCGVKGIEVYSSYHTADDREWYGGLARELGLIATAGSDFHGKTKPSVFPGKTGASPQAEEELRRFRFKTAG